MNESLNVVNVDCCKKVHDGRKQDCPPRKGLTECNRPKSIGNDYDVTTATFESPMSKVGTEKVFLGN